MTAATPTKSPSKNGHKGAATNAALLASEEEREKRSATRSYDDFAKAMEHRQLHYAEFVLCGTASLLMNRRGPIGVPRYGIERAQARAARRAVSATEMQEAIAKAMEEKKARKASATTTETVEPDKPTIESALDLKTYRNHAGVLCGQSLAVRMSMLGAVKGIVWAGSTGLQSTLRLCVRSSSELFPLFSLDEDGRMTPIRTFNPRWDPGRNPNSIKAVGVDIWRPEIELPWYMPCRFRVDLDPLVGDITPIQYALTLAGERIGLGDWRQEKNGPMGTFDVAHFELVHEDAPEPAAPPREMFTFPGAI